MWVRDERGAIWTSFLLLMIPFLMVGIILTVEHPRMVHGSDVDLGQAVSEAARAAAMRVDAASQANGTPRIDPDAAHDTFRNILARQLELDGATLAPLPGSMMRQAPSYVLLVYNGDDLYTSRYVAKYVCVNGAPDGGDYNDPAYPSYEGATSFSQGFSISKTDVTAGSGGISVVLKTPGCIAVVQDGVQPVITGDPVEPIRWASARVVRNP